VIFRGGEHGRGFTAPLPGAAWEKLDRLAGFPGGCDFWEGWERWTYPACLCFGLDASELQASGFRYGYSACQAEYSRNLLFAAGGQMEDLSKRVLDRTRSRLDISAVRDIFGLKTRPHRSRASRWPPALHGFTAAEFASRVRQMTRSDGYTTRQAAYDLRKLRGKNLLIKPGRSRRYQVPPGAACTHHRTPRIPRPHHCACPSWRPQPQARP
jgi:hypothetical protein